MSREELSMTPASGKEQLDPKVSAGSVGQVVREEDRSALVQAWIENRMERDRSLLALSGGGIGLVVTLLATELVVSAGPKAFAALAMLSFAGSVACSLEVFRENSKYVQGLLNGIDDHADLDRLDRRLQGWFFLGVVALLGLGSILIL